MLTIPEQSIFGLDISQYKLRLAQVFTSRRRKSLAALREIDVPAGVIIDGEIADPKQLTQLVTVLYTGRQRSDRLPGNGVISVLPESKTFIKLITLDAGDPDHIEERLREEIPRHIPIPLEEIYYDWQLVETTENGVHHFLIGAAPRHLVDTYLAVLRGARLLPFALEIEAAPIARCLIRTGGTAEHGTRLIIDLGAARTGLVVTRDDTIQFSVSLPISGAHITQTIAATLKISTAEAEDAKVVCGLNDQRCQGALRRVLYATLDDLCHKIEDAIAFYTENFSNHLPITEVILTGGGANFIGIEEVLRELLKLPVRIGNPLTNVELHRQASNPGTLHSYTTAIGLALRGTYGDHII
ncbi:MAG: type IV pilus assembly protein PilM, partial [Patescibacteria group bacterium]|nr:type IV pilus assembly protein PilM [Patescibacteria group bacterium]